MGSTAASQPILPRRPDDATARGPAGRRALGPSWPLACAVLAVLAALVPGTGRAAEAPLLAQPEVPWRLDPLAGWFDEAEPIEERWFIVQSRGTVVRRAPVFVDVYASFALGLGGWQDRSFTATDPINGSYRSEQLSYLSGFVGNLSIGVQAAEGIAPMLRFSVGGGRHSYAQPGRGPEGAGYDANSNRRMAVSYGRFSVGFGLHFAAQVSESVSLFANVGLLFAFPFEETWTIRRDDPFGEQRVATTYAPGLGGFGDGGLLVWASPEFAFRIGVFLEGVRTSFQSQEWSQGAGAYATHPYGTIEFRTGDFADDDGFGPDGKRRVHKSSPEGFEGAIGAWGFTLGIQIWF